MEQTLVKHMQINNHLTVILLTSIIFTRKAAIHTKCLTFKFLTQKFPTFNTRNGPWRNIKLNSEKMEFNFVQGVGIYSEIEITSVTCPSRLSQMYKQTQVSSYQTRVPANICSSLKMNIIHLCSSPSYICSPLKLSEKSNTN